MFCLLFLLFYVNFDHLVHFFLLVFISCNLLLRKRFPEQVR